MRSERYLPTPGVRLYSEKKAAEAEAAFETAWALNPTVDVAYNLGTAEFQQGKHREAAEHLSFALRAWPLMAAMASQRPLAEKRLAESRTHVGALTVKVNVAQAEVLVDGTSVGKAPLRGEVFVEPGARTVEARLEGYASAKETIALEKGATRTMELTLVAARVTAADVNNVKAGAGAGQAATSHSESDESRAGGPRTGIVIAGIATSAVVLGAGVVFAVIANGHGVDADEQQASLLQEGGGRACERPTTLTERCEQQQSSLVARDTYRDVAIWSFVTGGVVGVGTAVYALASARKKPASGVRVIPVATAQAGGVVVAGEW